MSTSGAAHAKLMSCDPLLSVCLYVARPVELLCCAHLEVPKSPIWIRQIEHTIQRIADEDSALVKETNENLRRCLDPNNLRKNTNDDTLF